MEMGKFRGVFESESDANKLDKSKRNINDYCFIVELGSGMFKVGDDGLFHDIK